MAEENTVPLTKEALWYVDNYIVLIDYYDRTISRIAARCIRSGNIALEEYKFYPYVLDVLEEICETGNYILEHKELYPYIEKKIAGGVEALRKNLAIYQEELTNNQSPEMLRSDPRFQHIRVGIHPPRQGKDYNDLLQIKIQERQNTPERRLEKQAAISI